MSDPTNHIVNIEINKFPARAVQRVWLGITVGFGITFGFLVCISLLAGLAKLARVVGLFA